MMAGGAENPAGKCVKVRATWRLFELFVQFRDMVAWNRGSV